MITRRGEEGGRLHSLSANGAQVRVYVSPGSMMVKVVARRMVLRYGLEAAGTRGWGRRGSKTCARLPLVGYGVLLRITCLFLQSTQPVYGASTPRMLAKERPRGHLHPPVHPGMSAPWRFPRRRMRQFLTNPGRTRGLAPRSSVAEHPLSLARLLLRGPCPRILVAPRLEGSWSARVSTAAKVSNGFDLLHLWALQMRLCVVCRHQYG